MNSAPASALTGPLGPRRQTAEEISRPGLRVYKIYNGHWFFGRATVQELRLDVRAILQR